VYKHHTHHQWFFLFCQFVATGQNLDVCADSIADIASCIFNNALACNDDADCKALGAGEDAAFGDTPSCDNLVEGCKEVACCDECKTEGVAFIKCVSDQLSCDRKDCENLPDSSSSATSFAAGLVASLLVATLV
jgi:hypothetical protein